MFVAFGEAAKARTDAIKTMKYGAHPPGASGSVAHGVPHRAEDPQEWASIVWTRLATHHRAPEGGAGRLAGLWQRPGAGACSRRFFLYRFGSSIPAAVGSLGFTFKSMQTINAIERK